MENKSSLLWQKSWKNLKEINIASVLWWNNRCHSGMMNSYSGCCLRSEKLKEACIVFVISKRRSKYMLGCNPTSNKIITVLFQANPVNMSIKQINTPTIADDKDAVDEFYQQLEETFIKNEAKLSPLQLGASLWKFDCRMHELSERSNGKWLLIWVYWMKEAVGWTLLLSCSFVLHLSSKLNVQDIYTNGFDMMTQSQAILKDEHIESKDQLLAFWASKDRYSAVHCFLIRSRKIYGERDSNGLRDKVIKCKVPMNTSW